MPHVILKNKNIDREKALAIALKALDKIKSHPGSAERLYDEERDEYHWVIEQHDYDVLQSTAMEALVDIERLGN